ncbi:MAG: D-glycero-beta-D-manno-heptose-7-phosphate kinase [Prosthecochloris sp.]|nr:D-glycero-beta-D-manno-heptose-7-phosphate kinase [Prosthecochloris sp.]
MTYIPLFNRNTFSTVQATDIQEIFNSFRKCRIAIVGDIMLDKYIFGHVSRISPEYPVPVVDVSRETCRLGGAANVAVNIDAMGATALLYGVTGEDSDAELLRKLLGDRGLHTGGIISDPSRPTTSKTRILSQNHHIARVDHESRDAISEQYLKCISGMIGTSIDELDAIVLEDYNKGVLTAQLIEEIIGLASSHNVAVLVDPKLHGFFDYQGCTVFKPNLAEVSASLGISAKNTDEDIEKACMALRKKLRCRDIVITRSEKGMTIHNDRFIHIPAASLEVSDVSGAGDTVIALLALGIASGLDTCTTGIIANLAASTVCQEVGAAPVKAEKLLKSCQEYFANATTNQSQA